MLLRVAGAAGHFKLIVSLRTEFFGRLGPPATGSPGWRSYLLGALDPDTVAEAIELPTAREAVPYTDEIPYDKYGFAYEDGLPRTIARAAVDTGRDGRESTLPMVQVVCAQLADIASGREDRVIRAVDWRTLGEADGALARYVQTIINREWPARRDRRAVRRLLQRLHLRQPDGTLVRNLVPEPVLASGWRGLTPLASVIDVAADEDVRLLDVTWMTYQGEATRFVSLAQDALVPVAARWAEEAERGSHTQKRVVDALFITIPGILLALALAYMFYKQRVAVANEFEDFQKETAKELKKNAVAEETLKSARWMSYLGRLAQARRAWEAGNLVAFDLALHMPPSLRKNEPDLRGFEWYHLWRLGHNERATLLGHRGLVASVALSPDGKILASGSEDGTVKLWDTASGQERATLTGHKGPVHAVAVSGDGKLLATAGEDGVVRLWDATTGQQEYVSTDKSQAILQGHTGPIRVLAFTADGKTLASAGADKKEMADVGVIRLWDVAERKETKVLSGHHGPVNAVAFAPDGKTLASGGEDGVFLWDTASGQKQQTHAGHRAAVQAVAFSSDGKLLASGGAARKDGVEIGDVRLWDVETGKERGALAPPLAGVFALAFSPDGKTLVTGAKTNVVQVWDVDTGKERRRLSGHLAWVRTLALAGDGKTLATGSYDRTVRLWDLGANESEQVLRGHGDWVCAVALGPTFPVIASGGGDGSIKLWNAKTGAALTTLKGHAGSVVALAFSPKAKLLASGSWDEAKGTGELKVWDLEPGPKELTEKFNLQGHGKGVTCVAFSPDGRTLASGGADQKIILWDPATGKQQREIAAHRAVVRCLAFAPDGQKLASGGNDNLIHLWDAQTGKELPTTKPREKVLQVAPLEGHTAPVLGLAFAADSLSLASASADQTVKLWDVATGTPRTTLRGHSGVVFGVAFSPKGESLASGGWDGTVKLWDPVTGAERFTFSGHTGPVRAVAFAADGLMLASGSHDRIVRLWRAAPPERGAADPGHD
jgi:WD40 repeat protein